MNREQFMSELARFLENIPENERKEALAYYEDYFDDAGPEKEEQVIAELGYPYKVAENIKEGLRGNMGYQNTGAGYQNAGYQHIGTQNVYAGNNAPAAKAGNEPMPTWAIVLIVIACILLSPAILGAVASLLGVIIGIIGTLIGFIAAAFLGGVSLVVAGGIVLVYAFPTMFVSGFVGIFMIGLSLLFIAIGILLVMSGVWICGWALPAFIKWIVKMCRKLSKKEEVRVA